ncbi:MAG: enterochelin esterase [Gemmatimonadetes bacterium]|nr:MAG: enterochelin esterase [Gemmatimonadota bacterium]
MRVLPHASAFLFGAVVAVAPSHPIPPPIVSPTIAALRDAASKSAPDAEAQFWARVQRDGTPLVEPIPGDTANVLFTFVWHGDSATKHVALVNTAIASIEPAQALLTRIAGTDVWYRSYVGRADSRFSYELSPNDNLVSFDQVSDWGERSATFHKDPFNRRVHASGFGREQSVAEGPRARRDEWSDVRPDVAKGRVEQTTIASKLLGNTRDVWIYTPAGYDTLARKGGLPLLLTFDGGEYVSSIPVPTMLDNLVATKRIAPMVAVFVASPDEQRNTELNQNEHFAEFLATELVPWVRAKYAIASSPARNVVAGSSMGGLAAAFVANRHPEIFGNVLSQSGAYMFAAPGEQTAERMKRDIEAAPKRDIAYYLEAGIYEQGRLDQGGVDLLTSNRHLRDVLRAKGYRVTYAEYAGGHDDLSWRSGFPNGLISLVGR